MDFLEATRTVVNRIQKLDSENVSKIIGYLLLQEHGEKEMFRLAFGPDAQLLSLINKAKAELGLPLKPSVSVPLSPSPRPVPSSTTISDLPLQFTPFTPGASSPLSSPAILRPSASRYWDPQLVTTDHQLAHAVNCTTPSAGFVESLEDAYCLQNQVQFLSLDDQVEHVDPNRPDFVGKYYYPESTLDPLSARKRLPSMPEFPIKACHYFNKGYCKHGANCRYFHGQDLPDSLAQFYNPITNDFISKDHIFSPASLERLELELVELLKSRNGVPISIASLPMMYYENYGRNLQAEGYLTESQRHGKAGYSLTKLLARMRNSIRLIDRPHGQHSVVLAEDAHKYMEDRSDRSDPGVVVAGSRQIYLTFPAESTFTEEDVSNYFKIFGPVQDVRIPCQQKRMFGFVTFVYPETVKSILQKGNPHFVCGSRVLVKPYKEKSRMPDRKYTEKFDSPVYCPSHFVDTDSDFHSLQRFWHDSRLLRRQFEDHERMFELERRRLSHLQLAPRQLTQQPNLCFQMEESKTVEGHAGHNEFNYLVDVFNKGSTSGDKAMHTSSICNEQDSGQGINLPESPFSSAANSIHI